MIQFLIDEDVTPRLRDVAIARGYNAYHIQYLDWKGRKDYAIRRRMLEEDLTLVTGELEGLPADAAARGGPSRGDLAP